MFPTLKLKLWALRLMDETRGRSAINLPGDSSRLAQKKKRDSNTTDEVEEEKETKNIVSGLLVTDNVKEQKETKNQPVGSQTQQIMQKKRKKLRTLKLSVVAGLKKRKKLSANE